MCAVHSKRPSEVLVGLGGFKQMYPLVESIVKSNLTSSMGVNAPGLLLKWVFIILNTYLECEPAHIKDLFETKNLIQVLRYVLLRIGKYKMISQDLLAEVTNVVRKAILVRQRCTLADRKC